jgi:hypothetical protein
VKKAISFSGQSRFVKEGYNSLKRNLYDFESYDIFIHTWEGPLNKDCELYKPKKILIEPQKTVVPSIVKEYSNAHFIHFSMFYTMRESLRLKQEYEKENNFKYDLVIRTRFDIGLETAIQPEHYDLKQGVYSPDVCGNPAVISDWFNFSDSKTIDLYGEIYDNIVEYHKKGVMITSGEEIITHMLNTKNISIKKIKSELFLLRDRAIHSNLSSYWKYAN